MINTISILNISYIKVPQYLVNDSVKNYKTNIKRKFSTNIPEQVSLNRKIFSEKRGRVLKTK